MSKKYRPSGSERGATAKWADVDLEGDWPWVIVRDSKTEAGQRVPHIADVDEFPLVLGTNPEKQTRNWQVSGETGGFDAKLRELPLRWTSS